MHIFTAEKYSIEVGSVLESSLNELLLNSYVDSKVIIIVDENTHDYCLEFLLTSFNQLKDAEVMLLPVGEENKVMEVCFQVWQALSDYQIGRKDLIINLGGGVVTDMGGFIASIYKRGVDFVNIPTSLLGMVDASIGGKTGIDLGAFKNQLGVFKDPIKIYIDPGFLETLPDMELLNGYAEMLKHALIRNRDQWNELKNVRSLEELVNENWILNAVQTKFDIVSADPFEKNIRKLLNFGHTVGHAIEGFLLDKEPIGHGHAVAIGMVAESYIAFKKGKLSKADYFEIELVITEKFPLIHFEDTDIEEIIQLTKNDKKNESNKINCTLLNKIGEGEINCEVNEDEIRNALEYLNQLTK